MGTGVLQGAGEKKSTYFSHFTCACSTLLETLDGPGPVSVFCSPTMSAVGTDSAEVGAGTVTEVEGEEDMALWKKKK